MSNILNCVTICPVLRSLNRFDVISTSAAVRESRFISCFCSSSAACSTVTFPVTGCFRGTHSVSPACALSRHSGQRQSGVL